VTRRDGHQAHVLHTVLPRPARLSSVLWGGWISLIAAFLRLPGREPLSAARLLVDGVLAALSLSPRVRRRLVR